MHAHNKRQSAQSGFTLVELSIVLVIIGLIVGGVLTGQALIAAARVRAQLTQLEQLDTGANAFRSKFDCLPGDCRAQNGITVNLAAVTPNSGDGLIDFPAAAWDPASESAVVPFQLQQQAMISATLDPLGAAFAPAMYLQGRLKGHVTFGSDTRDNLYLLGLFTGDYTGAPGLPAEAAFAIDSKRDDNNPITGSVTALINNTDPFNTVPPLEIAGTAANTQTSCRTVAPNATAAYNATFSTANCLIRVRVSG